MLAWVSRAPQHAMGLGIGETSLLTSTLPVDLCTVGYNIVRFIFHVSVSAQIRIVRGTMLANKLTQTTSRAARVQPFVSARSAVSRKSRPLTMRASASYDLDPDNASILVCGGGGVALHVTRKLKDMGSWVWMMQRTDVRKKEIEKMMAFVPKGDALNKDDVQKVFDGEAAS